MWQQTTIPKRQTSIFLIQCSDEFRRYSQLHGNTIIQPQYHQIIKETTQFGSMQPQNDLPTLKCDQSIKNGALKLQKEFEGGNFLHKSQVEDIISTESFPLKKQEMLEVNEMPKGNKKNQEKQKRNKLFLDLDEEDLIKYKYSGQRTQWREQEDTMLLQLVLEKSVSLKKVHFFLQGRSQKMCEARFRRLMNPTKDTWTRKQDDRIRQLVQEYGDEGNWRLIATKLGQKRTAKQVKDHYNNFLSPNLNLNKWTLEEDLKLIQLLNIWGEDWKKIQSQMEGRTIQRIKNQYNGKLKRIMKDKKDYERSISRRNKRQL